MMNQLFFNGIKFFSDNNALLSLSGTATASSAAANAGDAFNGNRAFGWTSNGENNDSITSYIERDFGTDLSGDTIVIANHNLKAFSIKINGSYIQNYCESTKRNFSVITFPARSDIRTIRIEAAKTETANEEKHIGEIMLLTTIGQFEDPQKVTNSLVLEQGNLKLQNGKHFIFNCGESWVFTIEIFALAQCDIDLLQKLRDLGTPFHVWPCGGTEVQFAYNFRPYFFNDFFKVAFSGDSKPNLKDGLYYGTGLRDTIKLVEVE